nr:MAG TPA: hypothetical protein [Caudoviricetes sp.]
MNSLHDRPPRREKYCENHYTLPPHPAQIIRTGRR